MVRTLNPLSMMHRNNNSRFTRRMMGVSALAASAGIITPLALLPTTAFAEMVEYTWTLQPRRAQKKDPSLSPDCYLGRHMLLVNDSLPGPTLTADVGDTIRVVLVNNSPSEAISLHFHGLTQKSQPYSDGTSTASQCATGPMQTQVYEFVAVDPGTHYWHGHLSMDRTDGFQGPLVILNPDDEDEKSLQEMYDEEATVFLQDWYHLSGPERRTGLDTNPFIWVGNAQSFLINGGGVFEACNSVSGDENEAIPDICADDCSADKYVKTIEVEAGKTYRLRVISAASLIGVNFAIMGHNMTVVEADGTLVEPFQVSNLDVMPAQRFSVLVTMDQPVGMYWATTSVRYRSTAPQGFLAIKYAGASEGMSSMDVSALPDHPTWDNVEVGKDIESKLFTKNLGSHNDSDVLSADPSSIRRLVVVGTQCKNPDNGQLRWACNNVTQSFPAKPVILSAYESILEADASTASWPNVEIPDTVVVPDRPPTPWNYTEPVQESVGEFLETSGPSVVKLTKGDVVDLVLQNARALNGVAEMHSWHLHGHKFYVVGMGEGTFDEETDVASFNLQNPVRRDTVAVLPLGWTAVRFKADNPGVWAVHCTQNAHSVMGMGFNLVVSPDLLDRPPPAIGSCGKTSLDVNDAEVCEVVGAADTPVTIGEARENAGASNSGTRMASSNRSFLHNMFAVFVGVIPMIVEWV